MGTKPRGVTTRRLPDQTRRITIRGPLTLDRFDHVENAIAAAIRSGAENIELDLTTTEIETPDDLIVLLDLHHIAKRNRTALRLVNVPQHVREMMSSTLLPALLPAG